MLRKKMVRRLGHFKRTRYDGTSYCVRYFYDGGLCEQELLDLLRVHIRELGYKNAANVQILYQSPMSPWLENSILATISKPHFKQPICLDRVTDDDLKKVYLSKSKKPLLVVDMVDSGQTLRGLIERIISVTRSKELPHVLAILVVNPSDRREMKHSVALSGGKRVEIKYLMEVEQLNFEKGQCPMCELSLPFFSIAGEDYCCLTSYDHWDLASNVKLKPEDNIPSKHRLGMAHVINYPKMPSRNGAWLASKVRQRLYQRPEGYPPDVLLICPAAEKGSQVFSGYLKLILQCDVIEIPRDVIEEFSADTCNQDELIKAYALAQPEWYTAVKSSLTMDVMVIDEFNASGGTCTGIVRVLRALGRNVTCYFPLNDLNPEWSQQQNFDVYALYEWQAMRAEAK